MGAIDLNEIRLPPQTTSRSLLAGLDDEPEGLRTTVGEGRLDGVAARGERVAEDRGDADAAAVDGDRGVRTGVDGEGARGAALYGA
jgi:hypothetical protein